MLAGRHAASRRQTCIGLASRKKQHVASRLQAVNADKNSLLHSPAVWKLAATNAGLHRYAPLVIVRKRSCPAVSQICSLTHFPSISTFLILKSMLQASKWEDDT